MRHSFCKIHGKPMEKKNICGVDFPNCDECTKDLAKLFAETLRLPKEGEIIIRGEIWARVGQVSGNQYQLDIIRPEYLKRHLGWVHHFDVDKTLDIPLTCGSCTNFCGNDWCCVKALK